MCMLLGAGVACAQPMDLTFTNNSQPAYSAASIDLRGRTLGTVTLASGPSRSSELIAIENTGNDSITGTFANVAEGGMVDILHGGRSYRFRATYWGGDGNDFSLYLDTPVPEIRVIQNGGTILADGGEVLREQLIWIGVTQACYFQIENRGDAPLENLTYTISGPHAADYSFETPPPTVLSSPYGYGEITVNFHPSALGERQATLTITSNDPTYPTFTLELRAQSTDVFSPHFRDPLDIYFIGTALDPQRLRMGAVSLDFVPTADKLLRAYWNTGNQQFDGRIIGNDGDLITGTYQGVKYHFQVLYDISGNISLQLITSGMLDQDWGSNYQSSIDMGGAIGVGPWRQIMTPSQKMSIDGAPLAMNFLRKDGGVDSFMPHIPVGGDPSLVLVQDDGKFFARTADRQVHRYHADGSLDADYTLLDGVTTRIIQLRDRRLACCAYIRGVGWFIRVMLPDGTPDPAVADMPWDGASYALAEQPDGKLLVAGERRNLSRLNTDGTLDTSFNCTTGEGTGSTLLMVSALLVLPDGKIMMGGHFESVNGDTTRRFLVRLNPDGSTDETFNITLGGTSSRRAIVTMLMRLTDGSILAGGDFNAYSGPGASATRYGLLRLLPDGSLDSDYDPLADSMYSGAQVRSINMLWDGSLLVGFADISIGHVIQRFLDVPPVSTVAVTPGTGITWVRNAGSADFSYTTFEYRGDGETAWTSLGHGVRDGAGWKCAHTGALPASGFIRVRGRLNTSNRASSVVMESHVYGRTALTKLEQWRAEHFGNPIDDGPGANGGDADGDGIRNLIEYSLGRHPRSQDQLGVLPTWMATADGHELTFTPVPETPINYGAEWSATLDGTDWQPAQKITGPDGRITFRVPNATPTGSLERQFFRLKFTE